MAEQAFIVLFACMILGVLIWFVLLTKYFTYLKGNHEGDYVELGSPHLVKNNTPSHTFKLLKYIWSDKPSVAGDSLLLSKTKTLRVVFVACSLLVVSGFVLTPMLIPTAG